MTDGQRNAIAVAILAIVPTLLFADVLTGVRSFYYGDVSQYHYPLKQILREIVLSGEFPYWNPYLSGGQPLAANPAHEVFYPLTWLILLPSFRIGFHLLVLAHVYLATFGMYALLRSMPASRTAAVLGAVSFGIGGLLLSTMNLFPFLFSTAWIPWVALFARRCTLTRSRRDFVLATLCLGVQFLIGEPITSLQTGMILGLFALAWGMKQRSGAATARAVTVVAAISIGALGVSAVQILPAADHFRDSTRRRGIPFKLVSAWSTPPVRFAELFYPDLLGDPRRTDRHSYWGLRQYGRRQLPFFIGIYPGLLIVVLVVTGIIIRARGRWLLLVTCLISFLLAIGDHTPILRLLYGSGIASAVRYPEKFLIMGIVAIVVFGALVIDRLLSGDQRARRVALLVTGVVTAIALAAAILASTPLYEPLFRTVWGPPEGLDARQMLRVSQQGWGLAAARGAILLLLIATLSRMPRTVRSALIGVFVLVDLGSLVPRLAPRYASSFYDEPPAVVRQFPSDRTGFRIFYVGDLVADVGMFRYNEPHPDSHWVRRNSLRPPSPAAYGLRLASSSDYDLTSLQPSEDFVASTVEVALARTPDWLGAISSMSNAWYVGIFRPFDEAFAEAKGVRRNVQPVRFVEMRHSPRYYFATELVSIRDRKDFVRLLKQRPWSRRAAFVAGPAGTPARGAVRSVREWNNGARLHVETGGDAFLVMSVTPHKYWTITVDGVETPAVVTNIGYQGIVVPGGRHVVEMRYHNPLIAAGAAVSIATLLLLILILRTSPPSTTNNGPSDGEHIGRDGDPGDSPP